MSTAAITRVLDPIQETLTCTCGLVQNTGTPFVELLSGCNRNRSARNLQFYNGWDITGYTGLFDGDNITPEYRQSIYRRGRRIRKKQISERIITVTLDIQTCDACSIKQHLFKLNQILDPDFCPTVEECSDQGILCFGSTCFLDNVWPELDEMTLRVTYCGQTRCIDVCRIGDFIPRKVGDNLWRVRLTFSAGDPSFYDCQAKSHRIDWANATVIGCMRCFGKGFCFSDHDERKATFTIAYNGDVARRPRMQVGGGINCITFLNNTTGQELTLDYRLQDHESVVIDLLDAPNVSNNFGENLYTTVFGSCPTANLARFGFQKGCTDIEFCVTAGNVDPDIAFTVFTWFEFYTSFFAYVDPTCVNG